MILMNDNNFKVSFEMGEAAKCMHFCLNKSISGIKYTKLLTLLSDYVALQANKKPKQSEGYYSIDISSNGLMEQVSRHFSVDKDFFVGLLGTADFLTDLQ